MKAVTLLAALAALGAVACGPRQTTYRVRIDPTFVPSHAEAVLAAIDSWTAAVPELHVVAEVGPCEADTTPGEVCVLDALDYRADRQGEVDGWCDGAGPGDSTVRVYTSTIIEGMSGAGETSARRIQRVAAHELGHAFGLGHSRPGLLMAPDSIDDAPEGPAPDDVRAFWAL